MGDFLALIHRHFHARRDRLPSFDDAALARLEMPLFAAVGARDALLDSAETARRLAQHAPKASVRLLADAGHLVRDQTEPILEFLRLRAIPD